MEGTVTINLEDFLKLKGEVEDLGKALESEKEKYRRLRSDVERFLTPEIVESAVMPYDKKIQCSINMMIDKSRFVEFIDTHKPSVFQDVLRSVRNLPVDGFKGNKEDHWLDLMEFNLRFMKDQLNVE